MSTEYLQSQIKKMLEEADRVEEQLSTMSLRERAKLDQYHHFSVAEMDEHEDILR